MYEGFTLKSVILLQIISNLHTISVSNSYHYITFMAWTLLFSDA